MKIYTRGGDKGETALRGGGRVSKDHIRVRAYGEVDELNAALGAAEAAAAADEACRGLCPLLESLQNDLFELGAELSDPQGRPGAAGARVAGLEAEIDRLEAGLEPLRRFILPGGCPAAAALHLARTVSRRAERAVVALSKDAPVSEGALRYLNRLSDLLFVLAREANRLAGIADRPWNKTA